MTMQTGAIDYYSASVQRSRYPIGLFDKDFAGGGTVAAEQVHDIDTLSGRDFVLTLKKRCR